MSSPAVSRAVCRAPNSGQGAAAKAAQEDGGALTYPMLRRVWLRGPASGSGKRRSPCWASSTRASAWSGSGSQVSTSELIQSTRGPKVLSKVGVCSSRVQVVPTEEHVTLSFERTSVEWFAYLVTALGIVGLVLLVRRGTFRFGGE